MFLSYRFNLKRWKRRKNCKISFKQQISEPERFPIFRCFENKNHLQEIKKLAWMWTETNYTKTTLKINMSKHKSQTLGRSYDCRFLVSMKEKQSVLVEISQSVQKPPWMNTEINLFKFLWFLLPGFYKRKRNLHAQKFDKKASQKCPFYNFTLRNPIITDWHAIFMNQN